MVKIKEQVQQGNKVDFMISENGTLLYKADYVYLVLKF